MLPADLQQDVNDIGQIPIVPVLLNVICQTTGMGFTAIARVTEDKWVTCSVLDNVSFGLKPGDELQIKTTICDEVRQLNKSVVIDHVAVDPDFANHPTPAMYGFQSYISVPIMRKDGSFFGTLCAIDPKPNKLNTPAVIGMFNLFADLISFHLSAVEQLKSSKANLLEEREVYQRNIQHQKLFMDELERQVQERTKQLLEKNVALEKMNTELESFAYVSSHDLQEPLRKIQTFSGLITEKEKANLSEKGRHYFDRIRNAAHRMQMLIQDVLAYSRLHKDEHELKNINLGELVAEINEELKEDLKEKNGLIEIGTICAVNIIEYQFRQLLYNIIGNAIKFAKPGRPLKILINSSIALASELDQEGLAQHKQYCHISISDNGIGFEQEYSDKIFKLFQRLNTVQEYDGTGIGLAIVKKIVDNHHGLVTAEAKLHEGATFNIYLPVD